MSYCTACGTEVRGGRFCGECGMQLAPASPQDPGVPRPASQGADRAPDVSPGHRAASLVAGAKGLGPMDLVYPGAALLLLAGVLMTDWFQTAGLWESSGEGPHVLVVLAVLLAMGGAVLRLVPRASASLPLPVNQLRLALVAPLVLAVVVGFVQVLGEEEGMGPGIQLAAAAAVVVALQGARPDARGAVRAVAIGCLSLALLSVLWPLRHLFPLSSFTTPLLLIGLLMAGLLGWLIRGLVVRSFPDWAALIGFGAVWLLVTLLQDSASVAGVGSVPLLFLAVGVALALAPGMGEEMNPPARPADRWLQAAAGMLTYGVFGGAMLALISLTGLSAISGSGVGGSGTLVLLLVAGVACAIACGVGRGKLIREPADGRIFALILAAVGAVLTVVASVLGSANSDTDGGAAATLLLGLVGPAVIAGLLLLPPSVRARYGLPWVAR